VSPLLLLLLSPLAQADPAALADRAVRENPDLVALEAQASALSERAAVAGAWMDPVVGLEYSNVPPLDPTLGAHPMAGLQLKLTQGLKPRGWSEAQRAVVEGREGAVRERQAEAALQLRAAVHRAWWGLARNAALEAVTRDHLARTEELLAAATARYQTGQMGQHGVLRLTVLRDRLADDLADFARTRAELTAALQGALGGGEPGDLGLPDALSPLPAPAEADWAALARQHRPALAALAADAETAGRQGALARIDGRPDLQVWAGYRVRAAQSMTTDPGTDLVSLGVGVPVPAGSKRRADGARAAASAEARAARARADALEARAAASAASAHARWARAAQKTATLDDTLLPGARATLETTRGDFTVGRADFASLFEAEVALLQLERARIQAAVDTHLARIDLRAAIGTDAPGVAP
jgi:outer membrane protein TolC